MESINVLIDDFGVTKLDESKDNDVFGGYGSSKITTDNVEMLSTISLVNTLQTFNDEEEDEQEEYSLQKWANNAHSTDNITSNVEGGVRIRWHSVSPLLFLLKMLRNHSKTYIESTPCRMNLCSSKGIMYRILSLDLQIKISLVHVGCARTKKMRQA